MSVSDTTMAITDVLPYIGVDEITGDKFGLLKALVAEMIGTLFLVVVGCGSCYANTEPESDDDFRGAFFRDSLNYSCS